MTEEVILGKRRLGFPIGLLRVQSKDRNLYEKFQFPKLKVNLPKMKNYLRLVAVVAVLALAPSAVHAQTTASQTFTMVVPSSISISAPAAVSLTHDQTDNPQAFPVQTWTVRGNARNGMTVSFASDSFVNPADTTFKRNAKLDLALKSSNGTGAWNVTVPSSTSTGTTPATVTATTTGVGRASLDLVVSFLTEDFSSFVAGTYTTTVVGTVVANP